MKDIVMERDLPRLMMNIIYDTGHPPRHFVFVVEYQNLARHFHEMAAEIIKHCRIPISRNNMNLIEIEDHTTFRFVAVTTNWEYKIRGLRINESFVELSPETKKEHQDKLYLLKSYEMRYGIQNRRPNTFYNRCMRPFRRLRQRWKNTMECVRRSKEF